MHLTRPYRCQGCCFPSMSPTGPGSLLFSNNRIRPAIMNITITISQVSLGQSGMGLASVEQQWSCLLPNLLVKDQVFVVLVNFDVIIVIAFALTYVVILMIWLQAGYPVFQINLPKWCVFCADIHYKVTFLLIPVVVTDDVNLGCTKKNWMSN